MNVILFIQDLGSSVGTSLQPSDKLRSLHSQLTVSVAASQHEIYADAARHHFNHELKVKLLNRVTQQIKSKANKIFLP